MKKRERVILHSDLNNFFASVEIANNPALKGLPVAVCGDPKSRHGVVLAKNEEAKKCGVTGTPLFKAIVKELEARGVNVENVLTNFTGDSK